MMAIQFDKQFVELALDALESGKPIPLPAVGHWSRLDMLTLGGVLLAGVVSHGPDTPQGLLTLADFNGLHPERKEAIMQRFHNEIVRAFQFVSGLVGEIIDGTYGESYGEQVQAVLVEDGEMVKVQPVAGFKMHRLPGTAAGDKA